MGAPEAFSQVLAFFEGAMNLNGSRMTVLELVEARARLRGREEERRIWRALQAKVAAGALIAAAIASLAAWLFA